MGSLPDLLFRRGDYEPQIGPEQKQGLSNNDLYAPPAVVKPKTVDISEAKKISVDPELEVVEREKVTKIVELLLFDIKNELIVEGGQYIRVKDFIKSLDTHTQRANFSKILQDFVYSLPSINLELLNWVLLDKKLFKDFHKEELRKNRKDFYPNMFVSIRYDFFKKVQTFAEISKSIN